MSGYEPELYNELLGMAKTLLRHGSDSEAIEKHLRQKRMISYLLL